MRKYGRVDTNHAEIVDCFKSMGCSVYSLANVGEIPDLLVSVSRDCTFLVEIKDGNKPPSQRKLTEVQKAFHQRWKGKIYLVTCIDEVLELVNAIRKGNDCLEMLQGCGQA